MGTMKFKPTNKNTKRLEQVSDRIKSGIWRKSDNVSENGQRNSKKWEMR